MPSRTGQSQATQAQKTYGDESQQAFGAGQQDISQYNNNTAQLQAGKNVGANPYLNPQYLSAVNQLRSSSLNQATNAGDQQIRALNARTGGMNGTATTGAISDMALKKARLGSELGAQQTASDWTKNIGYQQQLAQMPLAGAAAESPYFGTSSQGQNSTIGDLTQFGLAQYGPWMSALSAIGGAGGGALAGFCPAEGSHYLMADSTERPVETLRVGDWIAGIDEEAEEIEEIQSGFAEIVRVVTENGFTARNSLTHAYALARGGFTVAAKSVGKTILTALGPSKIVSVDLAGVVRVFNIITNGSHTYRADGVWALGVGDAERHVQMNHWRKIGERLRLAGEGETARPEMAEN